MKRILVVEDELAVADVIALALRSAGFEPRVVGDLKSARDHLRPGAFAAVILDLGLPDGDGTSLCRWLRAHQDPVLSSLPVLIVTCRDEESDRVLGLELGADDYLVKPFSPRELVARVGSVLRRVDNRFGQEEREIGIGPLSLSRVSFTAKVGASIVALTKTEFELLWVLAGSPQRVFTRQLLVARAYAGASVSDRTVDSHVKGIRQKCTAVPDGWDPIDTVYGVGYRIRTP
jgi:DNA-binding response OmpR family regulator